MRVFLTSLLIFFVDPSLGEGFMHLTEGWLLLLVSFAFVGGAAALVGWTARGILRRWHARYA